MESTKKRIRREYEPLTIMAELVCTTPLSPMTQVYNASNGEYEPNRTLTPSVIHPHIVARTKDGSWTMPHVNEHLANLVWKVNGVDITTINAWQNCFTIHTSGATRGDISIMKNLDPGSYVELTFEAQLADNRLGVNIPIKCSPIVLRTSDNSSDDYSLSIGDDQIIQYNPFKDKLHLHEYKVAHGLNHGNVNPQTLMDENCYLRTIPIRVYKGKDILSPTAYNIEICGILSISPVFQISPLTPSNTDYIESITNESVTIDLRLIQKGDFLIRAYIGTRCVAQKQFSVNRIYPKFSIRPTNGTSISPKDKERHDVAMVDYDGNTVYCPESVVKITWKTDSASRQGVVQGEGGEIVFPLSNTGIGHTYLDDWLDVYCEAEQKDVMSIAKDESNNELTDENGDTLIFN